MICLFNISHILSVLYKVLYCINKLLFRSKTISFISSLFTRDILAWGYSKYVLKSTGIIIFLAAYCIYKTDSSKYLFDTQNNIVFINRSGIYQNVLPFNKCQPCFCNADLTNVFLHCKYNTQSLCLKGCWNVKTLLMYLIADHVIVAHVLILIWFIFPCLFIRYTLFLMPFI